MPTDPDLERKRAENIKKKEEERAAKMAELKQKKGEKAAERANQKAADDKAKADEEQKKKDLDSKREKNIRDKEVTSARKKGSSKYSKKDVMELKAVFDEYDKDKSGTVEIEEFTKAIRDKREAAGPRAGEKSSRAQRQMNEGISILDLSENVFHEMDADGNGEVEFSELLKLMFKYARPEEIQTMLSWVAPEPEPEPEPKPELSKEARETILGIFKLYDKDKSGTLTRKELKIALEKSGLDPDEINQYFSDYDTDDNGEIDKAEFMKLMESTGAFDDI